MFGVFGTEIAPGVKLKGLTTSRYYRQLDPFAFLLTILPNQIVYHVYGMYRIEKNICTDHNRIARGTRRGSCGHV